MHARFTFPAFSKAIIKNPFHEIKTPAIQHRKDGNITKTFAAFYLIIAT